MSLARSYSVALVGLDGRIVEVEADLANGLPGCTLIGLPDAALHEARDRIRAAVVNSGLSWPQRRITLALSPASLPKHGSAFDLAMAAAILAGSGQLPPARLAGRALFGELGLDGRVRRLTGVLPAALAAARAGFRAVVVPTVNAAEAALVPDLAVEPVPSLAALVALLRGEPLPRARPEERGQDAAAPGSAEPGAAAPDLADVTGQLEGRRAIEIAAAGGHHVFFLGPPGAGKTMLAERLPGVLPDLDTDAAMEVTAIHSVAGALPPGTPLLRRPPFASPHHTASIAALVGGGSRLARPGAVSLAHRGVLFLDEAPEFAPAALDALRQPLESGVISLARSGGTTCYPARFTLLLAANPCPCGAGGLAAACSCSPLVRRRYLGRLSGPLLDRVDLRVALQPVSRAALVADRALAETTHRVAGRVAAARERAARRLAGTPWRTNAEVPGPELLRRWPVHAPHAVRRLHDDVGRGTLSVRGLHRVLRVAWTVADLAGRPAPGEQDVGEARGYRLDRAG